MNPTVNRILHIIAIVVAVAVPVLTAVLTGLPATSKAAVIVAAVLGILSSLKGAFGTPDAPAVNVPGPRPSSAGPMGKQAGFGTLGTMLLVLAFAAVGVLATARICQAQTPAPQAIGCVDSANTYCVVPAAAVGWQINLKTGSTENGVALAGLALQHTFGTIPLGLGLYGGLGASANNQASYQGCVGLSITNWGLLCGGAQHATFSDNSTAWQAMLTFAGQLTFGGTPAYMAKVAAQAKAEASK